MSLSPPSRRASVASPHHPNFHNSFGPAAEVSSIQHRLETLRRNIDDKQHALANFRTATLETAKSQANTAWSVVEYALKQVNDWKQLVEVCLPRVGPDVAASLTEGFVSLSTRISSFHDSVAQYNTARDEERQRLLEVVKLKCDEVDFMKKRAECIEADYDRLRKASDKVQRFVSKSKTYVKIVMSERIRWQEAHGANAAKLPSFTVSFHERCCQALAFLNSTQDSLSKAVVRPLDSQEAVTDRFIDRVNEDEVRDAALMRYISPKEELALLNTTLTGADQDIAMLKEFEVQKAAFQVKLFDVRAQATEAMEMLRSFRETLQAMRESVVQLAHPDEFRKVSLTLVSAIAKTIANELKRQQQQLLAEQKQKLQHMPSLASVRSMSIAPNNKFIVGPGAAGPFSMENSSRANSTFRTPTQVEATFIGQGTSFAPDGSFQDGVVTVSCEVTAATAGLAASSVNHHNVSQPASVIPPSLTPLDNHLTAGTMSPGTATALTPHFTKQQFQQLTRSVSGGQLSPVDDPSSEFGSSAGGAAALTSPSEHAHSQSKAALSAGSAALLHVSAQNHHNQQRQVREAPKGKRDEPAHHHDDATARIRRKTDTGVSGGDFQFLENANVTAVTTSQAPSSSSHQHHHHQQAEHLRRTPQHNRESQQQQQLGVSDARSRRLTVNPAWVGKDADQLANDSDKEKIVKKYEIPPAFEAFFQQLEDPKVEMYSANFGQRRQMNMQKQLNEKVAQALDFVAALEQVAIKKSVAANNNTLRLLPPPVAPQSSSSSSVSPLRMQVAASSARDDIDRELAVVASRDKLLEQIAPPIQASSQQQQQANLLSVNLAAVAPPVYKMGFAPSRPRTSKPADALLAEFGSVSLDREHLQSQRVVASAGRRLRQQPKPA